MNLLVVDDEYYIVHQIETQLNREALGIDQLFCAYSANQARHIIETEQVDVLLTDIEMPQGNGFELMDWIKETNPRMLLLILTGHQRFDYAQRAVNTQCFSYILKPVIIPTLEAELMKAVRSISPMTAEAPDPLPAAEEMNDATFIERTRQYIREHLSANTLNRTALAEHLHMNQDYFSNVFHKEFGQTFSSYVTDMRIDKAKELLTRSRFSQQQISDQVGFSSCSYFSKQFKRTTGMTPQQYQEAQVK